MTRRQAVGYADSVPSMMRRQLVFVFAFATALGALCAGAGCGGLTAGSAGCVSNSDCPASQICGFAENLGCSARGRCFAAPSYVCHAYSPGCACNGATFNMVCAGLPNGYTSEPLAHAGQCEAPDAAVCNANMCMTSIPCQTDLDCASHGTTCNPCFNTCYCIGAGTFACGSSHFCGIGTEYCKVTKGGACCHPQAYSCEPLPNACKNDASCACVQSALGAPNCSQADGGVTVRYTYH